MEEYRYQLENKNVAFKKKKNNVLKHLYFWRSDHLSQLNNQLKLLPVWCSWKVKVKHVALWDIVINSRPIIKILKQL